MGAGADRLSGGSQKQFTFHGYFDMHKLYGEFQNFLEVARNYDMTEKNYTEKNVNGEKILESYVEADLEYTDYYMLWLVFKISMRGKDTEVKINGKTQVLTKGVVKVIINPYIHPDFQEKRTKSALMEFSSKLYDKYFGKDDISDCIGVLAKDIKSIKAILSSQVARL